MYDTKKIREKREAKGISGEVLAKQFGMSKESFYKMETEGHKPRDKKVRAKLQEWLGYDIFTQRRKKKVAVKTNGIVKDDFKEKYYALLEKYTLLLENKPK